MWCFDMFWFFSHTFLYILSVSFIFELFFLVYVFKKVINEHSTLWFQPELNKTWNYISNSKLIYYRFPEVGRLYDMNRNKLLYLFMRSYFDHIIGDDVFCDDLNLWSEHKSEKEIFNERDVARLEHKGHGYGKFTYITGYYSSTEKVLIYSHVNL